ncbi:MAG TPA: MotB family protein [Beijerinckiaceae bacterium]
MADQEPEVREIIIIRRRGGDGEDGHHGGAWKIAFADFMTAMMAFFLVLWIVNSTSKETRASVARYFNPVKLADTTPARKGLQDPREGDFDAAASQSGRTQSKTEETQDPKPTRETSEDHRADAKGDQAKADGRNDAESRATTLETRLFEEPQTVLAEIVAAGLAQEAGRAGPEAATPAIDAPYRDPFAAVEPVLTPRPTTAAPTPRGATTKPPPAEAAEAKAHRQPTAPPAEARKDAEPGKPATATTKENAAKESAAKEATPSPQAAAAAKALEGEIAAALAAELGRPDAPAISVRADADGLLISLTDRLDFTMFAVGSGTPHHRTVLAVEKIAKVLQARPGKVIVRGHTDARPFRKGTSDNWRLSSTRAQAAFFMLQRGGLGEDRLERVEGHGARSLRNLADPLAPENRRVEILLRSAP